MSIEEKVHGANMDSLRADKDYLPDDKLKKLSTTLQNTKKGMKSLMEVQSMFMPSANASPPPPPTKHNAKDCLICVKVFFLSFFI